MNLNSSHLYTRRELLQLSGKAAFAGALLPHISIGATETSAIGTGAIVGDPVAAKIGEKVLRDGGNAIDAAVATALAAGIVSPSKCGIGGYGGHAMVGLAQGKKITAIDFDSVAPAAARADMFPLNEQGNVIGNINSAGWLAAGVPGTAAGLELALQRYGTRSLRDLLTPAIQLCEEGVHVVAVKGIDDASRNDPRPEAAQGGNLPPEKQRNLALARMLKTFASRNSFDSFYRGDIADTIAASFQKGGGVVTKKDLAAFRAREVKPLTAEWNGCTIHTAPLPATGLLVLEALSILRTLEWTRLSASERQHAKLEALRIAWADRLRTFGDPDHINVPVRELLSREHLSAQAKQITAALKAGNPFPSSSTRTAREAPPISRRSIATVT
jgi:gamma-glutamyltranspeptidase / glutathione hydrolase